MAVIGDPADPVLPRLMTQLAAGPGYVAAGLLAEEGVVGLYDHQGRMIDVVGQFGAGPGEFRSPAVFPGPGSSLWVVDISNQRITELDDAGRQVRSFPFSGAIHIAQPVDSSRMVVGGMLSGAFTPDDPGTGQRAPPYYIVDADLRVEHAFGEWQREGTLVPLNITVGGDGHLYQSGEQVYTALELTEAGEPFRRYSRDADWFPPGDNRAPDPNNPTFWHLRVDSDRRLWAITVVPAGAYRAAFDGSGSRGYSVLSFDRIRDSVVEVWDLESGQVVARSRFPQSHMGFVRGSDEVYTVRQDSMGYVYFDLWDAAIGDARAAADTRLAPEAQDTYPAAVRAVVDALGDHPGPVLVDPRPVAPTLRAISDGLPELFVAAAAEETARRRAILERLGIPVGDAVTASGCWATRAVPAVGGREPDSAAIRALREQDARCRGYEGSAVYLVVSPPQREPGLDQDRYIVVGYGRGCVWRWEVRVGARSRTDIDGGVELCT